MVKPVNIPAIEEATGASWKAWCAFLDEHGGAELDHGAIVETARKMKPISGWWAQSVAVAYEQHIGRRKPGQASDGLFAASVSRTIAGSPKTAFDRWCDFAAGLEQVEGQPIAGSPTTSTTPKRRYWRCTFQDGSRVALSVEAKNEDKVLIAIEHKKLRSEAAIADRKDAWAGLLNACFGA